MNYRMFTPADTVSTLEKRAVMKFLHEHLDEYGDSEKAIMNAIEYALSPYPLAGGFILTAEKDSKVVGAVVMNQTGMKGYIPENILVYIAVDRSLRGEGLGKKLMNRAIKMAKGDIALHVEPDNPARHLYEKLNFTNKYLEMRLLKSA